MFQGAARYHIGGSDHGSGLQSMSDITNWTLRNGISLWKNLFAVFIVCGRLDFRGTLRQGTRGDRLATGLSGSRALIWLVPTFGDWVVRWFRTSQSQVKASEVGPDSGRIPEVTTACRRWRTCQEDVSGADWMDLRNHKHWVDIETQGRFGGDGNVSKKKSSSKDVDRWLIYF
jgi:hypothetical protein